MRSCLLVVVAAAATSLTTVSARILHSLPEDTFAFPKFRVAFLNGLPVLNETAERWLKEGLRGGELEFLDQPWKDNAWRIPSHLKEIDSGDSPTREAIASDDATATANYTLEHMKMGPRDSYICLIPQPLENVPSLEDDDSDADVTPARSWSLLQPLSGTCLYHRQGWFTYSYCHNDEIRQFKELVPAQSRFTGTYKPEEDPEWDAYTLGRAPTHSEPGADLSVAEHNAQVATVELARGGGSRYLVQRWSDGTICDKTGKGREVEVQFHCAMEMSDHILFVKETKTCAYVLVVHTPRLCGEPGFKSRRDAGEEAHIRCREVVDTKPEVQMQLPTTDHPVKVPHRKTVLPAPKAVPKGEKAADGSTTGEKDKMFNDILRKTLEALVTGNKADAAAGKAKTEDEDIVIEYADDSLEEMEAESDRLVEALRAAGYDVRAEVVTVIDPNDKQGAPNGKKTAATDKTGDKKKKAAPKKTYGDPHRDEL